MLCRYINIYVYIYMYYRCIFYANISHLLQTEGILKIVIVNKLYFILIYNNINLFSSVSF